MTERAERFQRAASWKWSLALWGAAAVWVLTIGHPAETLEQRWLDRTLRWRAVLGWTPAADARVTILGIDDADMAALPSLEEEYRAAGRIIREASELGAAAVALDTIYARGTLAMGAPILEAIGQGTPVVLAEAMRVVLGGGGEQRLRSFPFRAERVTPAGMINLAPDADGTHRSYALLHWTGSGYEPSLALAAWVAARGLAWEADVRQPAPGVIRWPELSADGSRVEERELVERAGRPRLLNFRGGWSEGAGFGHLTLRRLHELHESARGGQPLAGKIILVANTATGIADVGPTAFGANEPLVLLHATALNDLLQDSFLRRAPRWGDALSFLAVPLLGVAMTLTVRKRWLLALWLIGLAGIFGGGLVLIFRAWLVAATIGTAGLWTVATVLEIARRHTRETAERQRLHATMGLYFSPRVLADVLANPGRLEPRRVKVAVLLSDLRNSTPLAERLGTDGVLDLLNRVFEIENRAVFDEDGSMEKPVGDQFLAYWGAPDPQVDAADRALRSALALIAGLEALPALLDPAARELFGYGVALHFGPALVANIGSAQFFHYGPIGDVLNATARVESLTKLYGVRLLLTREFVDKLAAPPPVRVLDRVIVKGKSTPLELCEVPHRATRGGFTALTTKYAEAFVCYQRGEFSAAARLFTALAPDDPPSRLLAERCTAFAAQPPAEWSGVFKMETK